MNNFLMGFGLGVTIGMLFAPKPGSETRSLLASKASEGTDYLSQQGQQLKDNASDLLEKGKQAVMNQKDKLTGNAQGSQPSYQSGQQSYQS